VDGSSLVLKCPPAYNTRLLRHEKHLLQTENTTLQILREYRTLPIPQVIKYDEQGGSFGTPFLLMNYLPGRRLSELSAYLSASEKQAVDRALGVYVRQLTGLPATQFGSTHRVIAKKGYKSWRDAFWSFLEAVLRDGEDMLITLPYAEIRHYVGRHLHHLDEVIQPRLVALDVCEPQNVLIDEHTKEIRGLVGFSNVIWGDPLMSGGIDLDNGSDAFFEGFGGRPARTRDVHLRSLM
jgi:aminoglycoside phosphotransferase (APT) family kinase protein